MSGWRIDYGRRPFTVVDEKGVVVCAVSIDRPLAKADALALAASRDTLDALRLLVRSYEKVTGRETTPLLNKARAAIAKAQGE